MKLPGGSNASIDLAKLRDYCLSPTHPRGKHKARVFLSALGFDQTHAEVLHQALMRAAVEAEAELSRSDVYGERYTVDFEIWNEGRRAQIRSAWIIRNGDTTPSLATCFVLLD